GEREQIAVMSVSLDEPQQERQCGGCHTCCVYLAIEALNKSPGDPCMHLTTRPESRCSIYPDRPAECRAFLCGWRLGGLDAGGRPDISGLLLNSDVTERGRVGEIHVVDESKCGDLHTY